MLNERALDLAGQPVERVTADDLDRPTPCADWRLEDLLRHLVSLNLGFAAAASGQPAVWSGADLGADPRKAYRDSAELVRVAFRAPDFAERRMSVSRFGEFSGRSAAGLHLIEVLAHGWDVAVSVGAPYELDDDLVEAGLAIAARLPDNSGLRGPGAPFGEVVPVAETASPFDRMLGLLGRDPQWSAA